MVGRELTSKRVYSTGIEFEVEEERRDVSVGPAGQAPRMAVQ